MINRILEALKPKTTEQIDEEIINKQKEAQELILKLRALEAKKKIDKDISKLKKQIRELS